MPTRSAPIAVGGGLGDLDDEADPARDVGPVAVGAVVGVLAQELVQQVAVGGVQLDAVGAGGDRAAGGVDVLVADGGELVGLQRARRHVVLHAVGREDLAVVLDRRRGDRLLAVGVDRVRDAAAVHELDEEPGVAGGVDGVGDLRPAGLLLVVVQARDVEVALADVGRMRALGDQDRGVGALGVVGGVEVAGDGVLGAVARQRRHRDAMGGAQAAALVGLEEVVVRHGGGVDPGFGVSVGSCMCNGRAGRTRAAGSGTHRTRRPRNIAMEYSFAM